MATPSLLSHHGACRFQWGTIRRIIARQHVRLLSSSPKVVQSELASIQAPSTVAVLYQAIEPPVINGARKPKKLGGYQDSGADIAFVLRDSTNTKVLTPTLSPSPNKHEGWCFPDSESGILAAVSNGATHLWANTLLFASHPLQASPMLSPYAKTVHVVGPPPLLVEKYDDKAYLNNLLRQCNRSLTLPRSWTLNTRSLPDLKLLNLPYPIVGKPVRGRGSHGVKVCHNLSALCAHIQSLAKESPSIMLEEYLGGEEATVTVMPPSPPEIPKYWALPVVTRFNHTDGVAPYSGVVAVVNNSRVVAEEAVKADQRYEEVVRECEEVGNLLGTKAPIRIDVRRFSKEIGSKFCLFDINMKPNMTGPGRPGREDQSSLTALAASALGWSYTDLLQTTLNSACTIEDLRNTRPGLV